MKKLAIINQRYGLEVNGGSEYYARLIAEHLNKYYDVEVLTTTALDYDTWDNFYPAGNDMINGVKIRRFSVSTSRNMLRFRIISKLTRMLYKVGIHLDKWWIKEQGPQTPELINYIKENKKDYDVFIFVTYLYYTTVMGLPEVADKAILIPTAHDEPYIHFQIYKKIFTISRAFIFLTEEEQDFVRKKFQNQDIPGDIIGVGIDIPEEMNNQEYRVKAVEAFRQKYYITGKYIIYAGRVDYGKKCDEMFDFFQKFKETQPNNDIQLVVIGKDMMGIPQHKDIHYLGFVPEEDKYAGIAGAEYLWLPSQFESLSIALLEAMALGIPGIVNGNCEVLKGHCKKSGAGVYYQNYDEFEAAFSNIFENMVEYGRMSEDAKHYVEKNYKWNVVEQKLQRIVDDL